MRSGAAQKQFCHLTIAACHELFSFRRSSLQFPELDVNTGKGQFPFQRTQLLD
jgi:hypothetical protein